MNSSNFRAEARNNLKGKWGKAACITLAYIAISFVISFIEGLFPEDSAITGIVSIAFSIIQIPLSFGFIIQILNLFKGEDVKTFDFLKNGFGNFKKAWGLTLHVCLKMLAPIALMIFSYILIFAGFIGATSSVAVGGTGSLGILSIIGFIVLIVSIIWMIPRSYSYQLAYIIAADNTDLNSKEAVEKSAEMMNGNRWKLFCLQLSFIGWSILAILSFGIGLLWLVPYMQFAFIVFYMFLNKTNSTIETTVVDQQKENNDDNGPIQEA